MLSIKNLNSPKLIISHSRGGNISMVPSHILLPTCKHMIPRTTPATMGTRKNETIVGEYLGAPVNERFALSVRQHALSVS